MNLRTTTRSEEKNILVGRRQRPTNLWGSCLSLIHRDGRTERANAEAANETANRKLRPRMERGDLNDHPNHEDQTFRRHCITTSEEVGGSARACVSGSDKRCAREDHGIAERGKRGKMRGKDVRCANEGTYECANTEQRDDQAFTDDGECASVDIPRHLTLSET